MSVNSTWPLETNSRAYDGISSNRIRSPLSISEDLLPIWILCESTSCCLTAISIYIAAVLIKHARSQSVSRLAKRQRDSMMFPSQVKCSSNENTNQKLPDVSIGSQKDDTFNPNPVKIPYNEQISVESAKSNSNLIVGSPVGVKPEFNFTQGQIISVHRKKETNQGKWLLRSILVCVIAVVLRCVTEQSLILMGNWSDHACDILTKLMITFTAVSLHCCHVFLWLRQLTFYSNPVLKPLQSKKLKVVSYAAYGIMPITLALTLALYMWWRDYKNYEGFCAASKKQNLPSYVPFSVLIACTVTIQVLLSSLFLYPLIVHKMKRRNSATKVKARVDDTASESRVTTAPVVKSRRSDRLMECIRRVLHGATVGITTDVVGGVVSIFLPDDLPIFALSLLYNLNVSLNLLCLIYTFANWRQMLFPWCCPSHQQKEFRNSIRNRRSSARQGRHKHSRRPSQRSNTVMGTKYTLKDVGT
ncbi:uncharacterized protein LOC144428146 [Styela clava]